jgi:cobalamin biosynthesis protein CobT
MNDVTFAKLLSSVMLDNRYDRFVKNRRTGKLNTNSLYKINTSSRLFKRREARKNKDYAVSLVVDCSGSMRGSKIRMAAESAEKLSHHLSKIGIPHNVVVFNAYADEIKAFNTKESETLKKDIIGEVQWDSYAYEDEEDGTPEGVGNRLRYASMIWSKKEFVEAPDGTKMMKFVKTVHGRDNLSKVVRQMDQEARERGSSWAEEYYSTDGPGSNSDAEALAFATKLLLKQKGTKLMVFLSDGQPAPVSSSLESPITPGRHQREFDVKKEVANTLRTGIELYSIGIRDSSVNQYYPPRRTATINDIKLLYPHIIKLIKINLKRG